MTWMAYVMQAAGKITEGVAGFQAERQNAAYASADARQAKLTAAAEASRERYKTEAALGEYRAAVGAQGTAFEGSPMLAYLENVKQGELMALDKIYEGKLKSRAFKIQRDIHLRKGWSTLIGGLLGAGGSAFSAYGASSGGGGSSGGSSGGGSSGGGIT